MIFLNLPKCWTICICFLRLSSCVLVLLAYYSRLNILSNDQNFIYGNSVASYFFFIGGIAESLEFTSITLVDILPVPKPVTYFCHVQNVKQYQITADQCGNMTPTVLEWTGLICSPCSQNLNELLLKEITVLKIWKPLCNVRKWVRSKLYGFRNSMEVRSKFWFLQRLPSPFPSSTNKGLSSNIYLTMKRNGLIWLRS
jgi:hypothetical protein